eukprot:SAG11_NODE_11314_length_769_cov_0.846269_1_plen_137_part_10
MNLLSLLRCHFHSLMAINSYCFESRVFGFSTMHDNVIVCAFSQVELKLHGAKSELEIVCLEPVVQTGRAFKKKTEKTKVNDDIVFVEGKTATVMISDCDVSTPKASRHGYPNIFKLKTQYADAETNQLKKFVIALPD